MADNSAKLKIASICIAIIGFTSLISTLFVPRYFNDYTLVNAQPTVLHENSADYVNQSLVYVITLKQGYKCDVFIANTYDNNDSETIDVFIAFVSLGNYLDAIENPTAPSGLGNLKYFAQNTHIYPGTATTSWVTAVSGGVDEGEYYTLEFMGGGDSNRIWSIPGQYAVVIWLTNAGGSGTSGSFGIIILVDGQGDMLNTLFTWIGLILLLIAGILAVAYIIILKRR